MDANEYRWTNERHLNFLKSVEASFVRTLLENMDGRVLLLDRHVPDTCESTLDSKLFIGRKNRKRHFPSDDLDGSLGIDRRVKRLRPQSSHLSQDDQVVPQIRHVKNVEGDHN